MEKSAMIRLFFVFGLLFVQLVVSAQAGSFEADIVKMQLQNDSFGTTDAMFGQIVARFKVSKSEVTGAKWVALKKGVFDVTVADLNKQLISVYKKHFIQEEAKATVVFYETSAGKKLAGKIPRWLQWNRCSLPKLWAYR